MVDIAPFAAVRFEAGKVDPVLETIATTVGAVPRGIVRPCVHHGVDQRGHSTALHVVNHQLGREPVGETESEGHSSKCGIWPGVPHHGDCWDWLLLFHRVRLGGPSGLSSRLRDQTDSCSLGILNF